MSEHRAAFRQKLATGDAIPSRKPADWDSFVAAVRKAGTLDDFLGAEERGQGDQTRDPFEGWRE